MSSTPRSSSRLQWLQSKLRQHNVPILLTQQDTKISPPTNALPYLSLLSQIEPSIPPTLSKYLNASFTSYHNWDDDDRRDSFWLLGRWVKREFENVDLLIRGDLGEHEKLIEVIQEKYMLVMEEEETLRKMREKLDERKGVGRVEAVGKVEDVEKVDAVSSKDPPANDSSPPPHHNDEPRSTPSEPSNSTSNSPANTSHLTESTDFVNVSMSVDDLRRVQNDWGKRSTSSTTNHTSSSITSMPQRSLSPTHHNHSVSASLPAPKKRTSSFVQSQHIADMRQTVQIGSAPHQMQRLNPRESLSLARESMRSLKQSLSGSVKSVSTIESLSRSMMEGQWTGLDDGDDERDDETLLTAHPTHTPHRNPLTTSVTSIPDESPNVRASQSSQRTAEDVPSEDDGSSTSSTEHVVATPLKFSSSVIPPQSQARQSRNLRYAQESMDTLVNQSTLYDRYLRENPEVNGSGKNSSSHVSSSQSSTRSSVVHDRPRNSVARSAASPMRQSKPTTASTKSIDRSLHSLTSKSHPSQESDEARKSVHRLPSDDSDDSDEISDSSDSDSGDDEVISEDGDEISALHQATRVSTTSFAGPMTQSLDFMDDEMQSAKSISFGKRGMGRLAHISELLPQRDSINRSSIGGSDTGRIENVRTGQRASAELSASTSQTHTEKLTTPDSSPPLEPIIERPPTPETYDQLSMLTDDAQSSTGRPKSASKLFERRHPLRDSDYATTAEDILARDITEEDTLPQKRRSFSDLDLARKDADFSGMDELAPPKTASGSMEQLRKENSKLRFMLFDFKNKVKQERQYLREMIRAEKEQLHERIIREYKIDPVRVRKSALRVSVHGDDEDSQPAVPSGSSAQSPVYSVARSTAQSPAHFATPSPTHSTSHSPVPSPSLACTSPSNRKSLHTTPPKPFIRPSLAKSNSYAEIHSPKNRQSGVRESTTSVRQSSALGDSQHRYSFPSDKSHDRSAEEDDDEMLDNDEDEMVDNNDDLSSTLSSNEEPSSPDSTSQPVSSYLDMFRKNKQSAPQPDNPQPKLAQSQDKLFLTELPKRKVPAKLQKPPNTVIEILPEDIRQSQEELAKLQRQRKFEQIRNRKLQQRFRRNSNGVEEQTEVDDREHTPDNVQEEDTYQADTKMTHHQHDDSRPSVSPHQQQQQRVVSKANMSRSNKLLIQNAIRHICLAGVVNEDEQKEVLQFLKACHYNHFLILVREAKVPVFRGLYAFTDDDQVPEKIYGRGPKHLKPEYVKFLHYDSAKKKFTEIAHAKSFSGTTDGVCLNEEYKRKARKRVSVV